MNKNENKDKLIESVFDDYMDGFEPSQNSLEAATAFLRAHSFQKRKDEAARKRPVRRTVMAVAAISLAAVMLFSYLLYSLAQPIINRPKYYSISAISSVAITEAELASIQNDLGITQLFPSFEENSAKYRLYYFKDSSVTAYIVCKARYFGTNGMVDITITAELGRDILDERKSFLRLPTSDVDGVEVNNRTVFEDGEYVTNAALNHNDIKYYLEIMSPVSEAIEVYARLILDL